jgi:hypothetical protein
MLLDHVARSMIGVVRLFGEALPVTDLHMMI